MHIFASYKRKTEKHRETFLQKIMKNILLPYEMSEGYEEEIIGEFENEFEKEYFQRFVSIVGSDACVLDLACGDGRHTLGLSNNVKHVIAFDLSPKNLMKAKRKCRSKRNITYIVGSMLKLPFQQKIFDGVWFSQAFEYVPPDWREKFLEQLDRILKPSGILYMSVETWMDSSILYSLKQLLGNLSLFCYWKIIKRKPLLWGEFLYYCSLRGPKEKFSGWHYHVHTDKYTLHKLLSKYNFAVKKIDLYEGYIYVLCQKFVKEIKK